MEKEHQNKFPSSYTIPMRKGISVSCVWVVCWGYIYSLVHSNFFFLFRVSRCVVRGVENGFVNITGFQRRKRNYLISELVAYWIVSRRDRAVCGDVSARVGGWFLFLVNFCFLFLSIRNLMSTS